MVVLQGLVGVGLTLAAPSERINPTAAPFSQDPRPPQATHTPHEARMLLLSPCFMGQNPEHFCPCSFLS